MPDEPVIAFKCPSCGKSYRVAQALAGRSAKCKKCGEKMRVPEPEPVPSPAEDDGFIPLVQDEEETAKTTPQPNKPLTFGDKKSVSAATTDSPAAEESSAEDSWTSDAAFSMSDLALLAAPDDEVELQPTVFATQAKYSAPGAAPRSKAAAVGSGLMKNMTAMWDALVHPSNAGGAIPMTRKISMGGLFLVVCSLLIMIFVALRATPEEIHRVMRYVGDTKSTNFSSGPTSAGPLYSIAAIAFFIGLLVMGWRYWSPRQDKEIPLIKVVFFGSLGMIVLCTLIAIVGAGGFSLLIAKAGGFGLLLAAAACGVWLYLRLAGDGDGSMALLLLAPAFILPATLLVITMANIPEGAKIGDLPWEEIILVLLVTFFAMILLGGAISFLILLSIPLHLFNLVQTPQLPASIPFNANSIGLMLIGGFCGLCYLLLVITRWRLMLKPVAWQLIILFVGPLTMLTMQGFIYNAQSVWVERAIAKEDKELTAVMQEQGVIPAGVTASHFRFSNSDHDFIGYDRKEIIYFSNGEEMRLNAPFHSGWVKPDTGRVATSTWRSQGSEQNQSSQNGNLFDPKPDPDGVTTSDATGTQSDSVRDTVSDTLQSLGWGVKKAVHTDQFSIVNGPNPEGKDQPGTRASWKPYPHSPVITMKGGADVRFLYFANGDITMNPTDDVLMDYGVIPDTRPTPVLSEAPVFTSDELATGFIDKLEEVRNGEPDLDWPLFSPSAVDMSGAKPSDVFGYVIDLLPGYEIVNAFENTQSGVRTVTIDHVSAERAGQHPKMTIRLIPQKFGDDGVGERGYWRSYIRKLGVKNPKQSHDFEYGWIDRQAFARLSPKQGKPHNYRSCIYYITTSAYTSRLLAISISSSMQTRESILACESMARSLRRLEVDQADVEKPRIYHNEIAEFDKEEMLDSGAKFSGIFAMPKQEKHSYDRASSYILQATNRRGVWMGWDDFSRFNDPSIFIYMQPLPKGVSPDQRVYAQGARIKQTVEQEGDDPRLDPYFVEAYGQPITYERLWNGEVFARVEQGPTDYTGRNTTKYVEYCGFLGDYWTVIRLFYGGGIDNGSLEEMEKQLRSIRLLPPKYARRFAEENLKRILSRESGNIPLAGGTTLAEAYVIDSKGQVVLRSSLSPQEARELGGSDKPEIATRPGLEPVEGFAQWPVRDDVRQYHGGTESFGAFTFKPLKDLRASAKNNDDYAEWFARTDAGKVGLTMKFERLLNDQEPIKVPIATDPASGEVTLQLGRRSLSLDESPDVSYRDTNGLRAWRILMPQAGGSPLRRCYYVVAVDDGHLVIAADFEREKAVQLQAMDASIASLVLNRPDVIE